MSPDWRHVEHWRSRRFEVRVILDGSSRQVLDLRLVAQFLDQGLHSVTQFFALQVTDDLSLHFFERSGLLRTTIRHLDDVVTEFGLDGSDDVASLGLECSVRKRWNHSLTREESEVSAT